MNKNNNFIYYEYPNNNVIVYCKYCQRKTDKVEYLNDYMCLKCDSEKYIKELLQQNKIEKLFNKKQ